MFRTVAIVRRAGPVSSLSRSRLEYLRAYRVRRAAAGGARLGHAKHGQRVEGYPKHLRCYTVADLVGCGEGWCAFQALARELQVACLASFARPE